MESTQVRFPPHKYENQISIFALSGPRVYFERISVAAKNDIMHPIPCPLHTKAEPNLVTNDAVPAHLLLEIVEPINKLPYSALKDSLEIWCRIVSQLKIGNTSTITPFSVIC